MFIQHRRLHANLLLLALMSLWAIALMGCAVGNKYNYRDVVARVAMNGPGRLALAVHDVRPEVVKGEEDPDYVGVQRGGFGNPFDVGTESESPLTEDWSHAVASSLSARGFSVMVVVVKPQERPEQVVRKLQATGAQALLLFILKKWHSDTFTNITLHHDVRLDVMNSAGAVLAEARLTGSSELGGDFFDPPSYAKEAVPDAFKRKLEVLLNNMQVLGAVAGATGLPKAPATTTPALPQPPTPPPP